MPEEKRIRIACEGAATLPLDSLEPFQGDLKTLDDADTARLRNEILTDGFTAPIHIWRNRKHNWIIDGHQRLAVLYTLRDEEYEIPELPVAWIEAESFEQAKRLVLAHTSQYGRVMLDGLKDMAELAEIEFEDLSDSFRFPEIDFDLLKEPPEDDSEAASEMVDKAAELLEKWGVERGQIWEIPGKAGTHRVMCGDSTDAGDVTLLMDGVKSQCVLTDPPYGQNQPGVPGDDPKALAALVDGAVRALPLSDGVCVAFQSPRTFPVWLDAVRSVQHEIERALWLYKTAQCAYPWRGWLLTSEAILVSRIGEAAWNDVKPYTHDTYQVSEVSGELDDEIGWHGSVKPLSIVADILKRICTLAGIVFDGFLGSGTTVVAAEQEGRICYGMEIEPKYVAVVLERMTSHGLKPVMCDD